MSHDMDLSTRPVDYVTAVVKASVGLVPFAGPFLAEFVGEVIPNQRLDRLAKFAEALARKLNTIEEAMLRSRMSDENFTDLLEESLHQVVRSTSDARREYIAGLLANGVKSEDISFIESKHLLKILGELNDIEVIWLRGYHDRSEASGQTEFMKKHEGVLGRVYPTYASPQADYDRAAIQESYALHMERLGLLRPKYKVDTKTKLPEFDRDKGMKRSGWEITALGHLLLRQMDMLQDSTSDSD